MRSPVGSSSFRWDCMTALTGSLQASRADGGGGYTVIFLGSAIEKKKKKKRDLFEFNE